MLKQVFLNIRHGMLLGYEAMDYICSSKFTAFRGIPYAKPPTGELRFKDSAPQEPWNGVRDASKSGPLPPQYDFSLRKVVGNEDCLYLDVYTKELDLPKRPVMAFIHGGEFYSSFSSSISYGPDYIVANDVVLVIINYRLGALGFLNLDAEMAPGNQGLKDALMALQWVHDNISYFGGDPENVTIFGQGFGGAMVHYLAMCPQADGLFHKAISQSGTAANTWAFSEKEAQKAKCFLLVKKLGNETTDPKEAVKFLKRVDTKAIIEASLGVLTTNEKLQLMFPFGPTEDFESPNPFFLENPAIMIDRGVKVPFIIGVITYERSIFAGNIDENALEQTNSNFESIIPPSILATLKKKSLTAANLYTRYFGDEPVSMKTISKYISFLGDMHFYRGIFQTICIQAQLNHRSTYLYIFSREPKFLLRETVVNTQFPGAIFNEEMSYLFCCPMSEALRSEKGVNWRADPERRVFREFISQMWTDFAKTGDPTPATRPLRPINWKPLETEEVLNFLIIRKNCEIGQIRKEKLPFLTTL